MSEETPMVYSLILNAREKMPTIAADPRRFAHMVQREMEDLMALIASDERMITIDGNTFDKTTSLGALIINDKLAKIESKNTQNFSFISEIRRAEDSLRQILG